MSAAILTLLVSFGMALCVTDAQAREQVYYFHNDHLGTPQAMTDQTGTVVWKAEYEPFGKAVVNQDPDGDGQIVINNLRFPGQYYDAETGLHYNYHRDYDPATGRYLQPDPIGLEGGANIYSYVQNNPINYIDPFGETALLWPLVLYPEIGGLLGHLVGAIVVGVAGVKLFKDRCDDGKYQCEGYANWEIIGANKHVIRGSWIVAYGNTEPEAAHAWKKAAQASAPPGHTARHVQPRCKKIR